MSGQRGNVHKLQRSHGASPASAGGSGDGHDPWRAMVDQRLAALEKDVGVINERTLHLATKADVNSALLRMVLIMLGTLVGLTTIVLTVVKLFVLP